MPSLTSEGSPLRVMPTYTPENPQLFVNTQNSSFLNGLNSGVQQTTQSLQSLGTVRDAIATKNAANQAQTAAAQNQIATSADQLANAQSALKVQAAQLKAQQAALDHQQQQYDQIDGVVEDSKDPSSQYYNIGNAPAAVLPSLLASSQTQGQQPQLQGTPLTGTPTGTLQPTTQPADNTSTATLQPTSPQGAAPQAQLQPTGGAAAPAPQAQLQPTDSGQPPTFTVPQTSNGPSLQAAPAQPIAQQAPQATLLGLARQFRAQGYTPEQSLDHANAVLASMTPSAQADLNLKLANTQKAQADAFRAQQQGNNQKRLSTVIDRFGSTAKTLDALTKGNVNPASLIDNSQKQQDILNGTYQPPNPQDTTTYDFEKYADAGMVQGALAGINAQKIADKTAPTDAKSSATLRKQAGDLGLNVGDFVNPDTDQIDYAKLQAGVAQAPKERKASDGSLQQYDGTKWVQVRKPPAGTTLSFGGVSVPILDANGNPVPITGTPAVTGNATANPAATGNSTAGTGADVNALANKLFGP